MSVHFPKIPHLWPQRSRGSLVTIALSLGLLAAPEPAAAQIVPVCDRTPEVRDEIVKLVPEVSDCADVTEAHLAAMEGDFFHSGWNYYSDPFSGDPIRYRLAPPQVEALAVGDFSGLSSVTNLYLDRTPLTSLPEGIFSGLSSLEGLDLSETQLSTLPAEIFAGLSSLKWLRLVATQASTLPAEIFAGLTALEYLNLVGNELRTLPTGVFAGLTALEYLNLAGNELRTLPTGVFAGLTALERLNLAYNELRTLPTGVFAGLTALEWLELGENPFSTLPAGVFAGLTALEYLNLDRNELRTLPDGIFAGLSSLEWLNIYNKLPFSLPVNVSLEWVDPGRFQARVHTGAPLEIQLPINVTNGAIEAAPSYVTIPAGRETSDVVSVSRQPGTTAPVTVEITQFPDKPMRHSGYVFVRPSMPLTVLAPLSLDFPHFANGASIASELVIMNVAATPIQPSFYFFDREGELMAPSSVVDVGADWWVQADGALTVRAGLEPLGELTVSTHGRGTLVTGSARVVADGPLGGVLRFDSPAIGVAGVGTGSPSPDVIFPVRRQESGINTGAAIRNLGEDPMTVNCQLMQDGQVLEEKDIPLAGNGQTAWFIDELFAVIHTADFLGSVRCTDPEGGLFAGVALEMDFQNQIFTTLPVVPVPQMRTQDYTQLHFAHFANGSSITSDLVFVNVASRPIRPAIYFYDGAGDLIAPPAVVDIGEDLQVRADGSLTIQADVAPLGELTVSTHGRGNLVTGSVRVIANGPIGGFLRFAHSEIGVAGIGASETVRDAIFPARNQARGIRTGMALRNLKQGMITITCQLMQDGRGLEEKEIPLAGNGQTSQFIHELFAQTVTSDFVGSARCTAPEDGRFTGLALEMDTDNRIFTTLPVVPVRR